MKFVIGTSEHTTQIVELLKITLGESLTKKTVEFWNWKHNQNPFGASKIILAFDGDLLIGVRAFMCWEFINKNEIVKCVRAVDTAVHPNYQGKGVFSKLTKVALDDCQKDGIDIVFNTPNKISKIGYLKLGWVEIGKLPIRLSFPLKIPRIYNEQALTELLSGYEINSINNFDFNTISKKISTPLTSVFINWRYVNCPINKYYNISKTNEYILIFRIRKVKLFTEMRLCEVAFNGNNICINDAISRLKSIIKMVRPAYVSCANNDSIPPTFFKKLFFLPSLKIGPIVTLKNVNYQAFESFKNFEIWQPTLGCLELF